MENNRYCTVKKTPLNCTIKDTNLKIEVTTVEPNNTIKLLRKVVTLKERIKKLFNLPERVELIKLSKKQGFYFGEKELNKNIVTEIRHYKGKRVIKVKTDINNRYLAQI